MSKKKILNGQMEEKMENISKGLEYVKQNQDTL